MTEDEQGKKPRPKIGGISQYASIGGAKTTKHQDAQTSTRSQDEDASSVDVQDTSVQDVQTSKLPDIQKPKRIRQTVYLEVENDEWVRDYINAERKRLGRRVEISDVINTALHVMRDKGSS